MALVLIKIQKKFPRAADRLRRFSRGVAWCGLGVFLLFVLTVLSLRYAILPHIENYRPFIERVAEKSLGQKLSIGRIEAGWAGIHPNLVLLDVSLADADGRSVFRFSRVEAVLSWRSILERGLRLRVLRINQPTLRMSRDTSGRLFLAGIALGDDDEKAEDDGESENTEEDENVGDLENIENAVNVEKTEKEKTEKTGNGMEAVAAWVFDQQHIRVDGATLIWEDKFRNVPSLTLREVNIVIDSDGRSHRFGITARPPRNLASRLDVRGNFHGPVSTPSAWRGRIFAEIDRVNLALWKRWADYPLNVSRGRAAARAWLDFSDGALREVTADVALKDVDLRFAEDLPALALERAASRLQASFLSDGFVARGRGVTLLTRKARLGADKPIQVEPSDFEIEWRTGGDSGIRSARVVVDKADIGTLARLTAHLPIDASTRKTLEDYAPSGRVSALVANWSSDAEKTLTYLLKAELRGMGVRAQGYFPGLSGLTGTIEATEKSGQLILRSGKSSIDLPRVFSESTIRFDSLAAEVRWETEGGLKVELARADFASPDAAGSAHGSYRVTEEGPGIIDLSAALTRADARAVWRYMPRLVSQDARYWLRDSLLAGRAEAQLTLKGNLKDFPFEDNDSGKFLVTVKARDTVLEYGKNWPRINGIQGDLRFEGKGMTINARRGRILGARLEDTWVRIPDFGAPVPLLFIKGESNGPTAEFLKFIERSPVAEWIDHATQGMRAAGSGTLDLNLSIPLDAEKLNSETKVAGTYHFANDTVTVDPALPALQQVNGSLSFSGNSLSLPDIEASLFGGPLKIQGGTRKDGSVLIRVDGTADINLLRQQSSLPALAALSGTAPYNGEIRIDPRGTNILIESNFAGLASTLPEPFAKKAGAPLKLRFEKRPLPARNQARANTPVREQIRVSLGSLLEARINRRKTASGFMPERGALAIGRPLRLPEKGFASGITIRHLDVDVWQKLFDTPVEAKTSVTKPTETVTPPEAPKPTEAVTTKASDVTTEAPAEGEAETPAEGMPTEVVTAETPEVAKLAETPKPDKVVKPAETPLFPLPDTIELRADELVIGGMPWNAVNLSAVRHPGVWEIQIDSRQQTGHFSWYEKEGGQLVARLTRLSIESPSGESGKSEKTAKAAKSAPPRQLSGIDIVADAFSVRGMDLGRLEVQARNDGAVWNLAHLQLSNPQGTLTGQGSWQQPQPGTDRTQLDFNLSSSDVGGLLTRLGYPGAVRAGTARLAGKIAWDDVPTKIDYASMTGELELAVDKGQFTKLDPGTAGKLLGLVSLRNLPRRITLDFKDVFSDGLAFDAITGKMSVQKGIMRTRGLRIDSPSAQITMRGDVDLERETQRLDVTVRPDIGDTAAIGVAVVNPVAGAATWLASQVLRRPLGSLFSYRYLITGTWDDPKVEKPGATTNESTEEPSALPASPTPAPPAPPSAP